MKRTWRFIKWFFSKCGWPEVLLFTGSFCFFSGLSAGEGPTRTMYWTVLLAVVVVSIIATGIGGARTLWKNFKEEDEKVFDILKKDNIK